jgi:hypothetical protein
MAGLLRDRLPRPAEYLRERGFRLAGGGEWKTSACPVCGTKKALHVRLDGPFRCSHCGVGGRDMLALHQRVTGKTFVAAALDLHCWG